MSLLKLGQHWSGWSTRHDRQFIRETRVNSGGRDTTAVVAHMYWGIPVLAGDKGPTKLAEDQGGRCVVATAPGWVTLFCMTPTCFPCVLWISCLVST